MKKMLTAILMALFIGTAANAGAATIFTETFDSGLGNWSVQDNNYDDVTWEYSDVSVWNLTGGSGGFAIADSYTLWPDNGWYDALVSPVIDVTGMGDLTVSANISYQHDVDGGYADITYSVDGGSTWLALAEYTATYQGAVSFDITLDSGTTTLQLSFEYYQPETSWYEYQVDNVMVEGTASSVPVPGAFLLLATGLATLAAARRQ